MNIEYVVKSKKTSCVMRSHLYTDQRYAPCPCLTPELASATADIIKRTVTALAEEGRPYVPPRRQIRICTASPTFGCHPFCGIAAVPKQPEGP